MFAENINEINTLPSFFSIANQKNRRIRFFAEPDLPFIIFLRTPNFYEYSFEPNPTDTVRTAISYISSVLSISANSIFLTNSDGEKLDENTILSSTFQTEDIILVSINGKIAVQAKPPAKDLLQENINKIVNSGYSQSSAKAALAMANNDFTGALELLLSKAIPDIDENPPTTTTTTTPSTTSTPAPTSTTITATAAAQTTTIQTSTSTTETSAPTTVTEIAVEVNNTTENTNPTENGTTTENNGANDGVESGFSFDTTNDQPSGNAAGGYLTLYQLRRSLTAEQRVFVDRLINQYGVEEEVVAQLFIINDKDERVTEEVVAGMI